MVTTGDPSWLGNPSLNNALRASTPPLHFPLRPWIMPLLCEPNDAVRAVAVAKRREYPPILSASKWLGRIPWWSPFPSLPWGWSKLSIPALCRPRWPLQCRAILRLCETEWGFSDNNEHGLNPTVSSKVVFRLHVLVLPRSKPIAKHTKHVYNPVHIDNTCINLNIHIYICVCVPNYTNILTYTHIYYMYVYIYIYCQWPPRVYWDLPAQQSSRGSLRVPTSPVRRGCHLTAGPPALETMALPRRPSASPGHLSRPCWGSQRLGCFRSYQSQKACSKEMRVPWRWQQIKTSARSCTVRVFVRFC